MEAVLSFNYSNVFPLICRGNVDVRPIRLYAFLNEKRVEQMEPKVEETGFRPEHSRFWALGLDKVALSKNAAAQSLDFFF